MTILTCGAIVLSFRFGLSIAFIGLLPIKFIYGLIKATENIVDIEFSDESDKNSSDIQNQISNTLESGKCPACLSFIGDNDRECSDCGLALK